MRLKNYKLLKYMVISFSLLMAFFFLGGSKVSAASTDLYFPNVNSLATGYDENGKAIIRDELYVYAHNNGAGRQIDATHTLRLYSVSVTEGTTSKTFTADDSDFSNYVSEISNGHSYNNLTASQVDRITLKIANILNAINGDGASVSISFEFQQRTKTLWWYGDWSSYTIDLNHYKGRELQNPVKYVKTDGVTLANAFNDSKNNITITISNDSNCKSLSNCFYNLNDFNNNKPLKLTINTSFKFTGLIQVKYINSKNSPSSLKVSFSNSKTGTIDLINSGLSVKDIETVYTFKELDVYTAKDKYLSVYNDKIDLKNDYNLQVNVDTVAPSVKKAGVIVNNNQSTLYDVAEVYTKFEFGERYKFEYSKLIFTVGGEKFTYTCSENCSPNTLGGSNTSTSAIISTIISGNGSVALTGFVGKLTDAYGNVKEYSESTSFTGIINNESVTLVSSVISVNTDKSYYYNGETISLNVSLLSDQTFNEIKVVLSNSTDESYTYISSSNKKITLSYGVGSEDSNTYLSKIEFYKESIKVAELPLSIYLNTYLSLELDNEVIENNKILISNPEDNKVVLYDKEIEEFNKNGVSYMADGNAPLTSEDFVCVYDSNNKETYCEYKKNKDSAISVVVERGTIVLANGQRNDKKEFVMIINKEVPEATITIDNSKLLLSGNVYYYKDYTSAITFNLSDGYSSDEQLCIYYRFTGLTLYYNIACGSESTIDLPNEEGTYELKYYTSDSNNNSIVNTYEYKFTYRKSFYLGNIEIKVNDVNIANVSDNVSENEKFNYLKVEYKNADVLMKEFSIEIGVTNKITGKSSLDANTFNVTTAQLGNIDDEVRVIIKMIDKLGNSYSKTIKVNVDTIAPTFDNVVVENTDNGNDTYTVRISGYDDNTVKVILDGVETELNNSYSFTTNLTKYTMVLIDGANNESSKVFTTVSPVLDFYLLSNTVYDSIYELNIRGFDSSIHEVEEYKYLVFDYTTSLISASDIEVARNNTCTTGRKIKCYKIGNYSSSSNAITQTFAKGYTYIIQLKINNVLVTQSGTSSLPRLNLNDPDATIPSWGYLDQDTNPDYISSVSGQEFSFKFLASDVNLNDTFYYLVVDNSIVSTINKTTFYSLYKNCHGANVETNGCGIYGELEYQEEVEDNVYLGNVVLKASYNTMLRLKNNKTYSLYVLLTDETGNEELFKVRDFTNISKSSDVKYLNDSDVYQTINDGEEVNVINTSSIKVSKYNNIDIKEVLVNGEKIVCNATGCNYTLGVNKYNIEVKDVLGNVSKMVIYSGVAKRPVIDVYYEYLGEYFKIIDNSFAYNTSNADKVFVKVSGNDINTLKVAMSSTSSYTSGNTIFDSLINNDNLYGVSLLEIMNHHNGSAYSGEIIITAISSSSGETYITLTVDNEAPEITLVPPLSKLDLLGDTPSVLEYNSLTKEYSISFNYQTNLTYTYLMKALSVKVDGIEFEEVIKNNRFKFRIDGNVFTDYDKSINKAAKITIDYFDNAGNESNTITINIICIPKLSLINALSSVELNKNVILAEVFMNDSYDADDDLILTVTLDDKDSDPLNDVIIDYKNHKFELPGEYTITYTLTDRTSNKTSVVKQVVIVKDTTPPVLVEGTNKRYEVGLETKLSFAMPTFVDNDSNNEYKPYEIVVYNTLGNVIDSSKANYPLSVSDNMITLVFDNEYSLGIYYVKFFVKDSSNNVTEEIFEIVVKDSRPPQILVMVNNIEVENGGSISLPLGSNVNIECIASDGYDGNISGYVAKTITYNGKKVNSIDTSKAGDYLVSFTVTDSAHNEENCVITIKIKKDELYPVINKVLVNGVELIENINNRVNGSSLRVEVEASDDSNGVIVDILVNNKYSLKNGDSIAIEQEIYDVIYTVKVSVKDTSNNTTTITYNLIVDNKLPVVSGVNNGDIYFEKVMVSVTDDNIELIEIYVNDVLDSTFSVNIGNHEISAKGVYRIVARDTYGNVSSKSFVILESKKFNIMNNNNSAKLYDYDSALLIETLVDNDKLTFVLRDSNVINSADNVYILVKYPNSNYKYVAYQMNGETYSVNNTISINDPIIEGFSNASLLEKIGDKYYAYVMVVKGSNVGNSGNQNNKGNNDMLKGIVTAVLSILGIILVLILFIKLRRRVRAI